MPTKHASTQHAVSPGRPRQCAPLSRARREPLYVQLAARLRAEVERGTAGQRIPGDEALCRQYGVSQPVVRGALKLLVDEGLVVRMRARGTFIQPRSRVIRRGTPLLPGGGITNIGVVAPLASFFPHAEALQGIRQVLAPVGCELILRESPATTFDPGAAEPIICDLLGKVAGLIWVGPHSEELTELPPKLLPLAPRVVFVNLMFPGAPITSLIGDYEGAAITITRHLLNLGRRRLCFIGGPRERLYAWQRLNGFRKAMATAGVPVLAQYEFPFCDDVVLPPLVPTAPDNLSRQSDLRYRQVHDELGGRIMAELLRHHPPPDAVFAVTDFLAAGVVHALRSFNLRIPHDVAIIGFDDSPVARHMKPALTTARLPYRELGTLAAQWLLAQLGGQQAPGARILAPCPLIVRESTIVAGQ